LQNDASNKTKFVVGLGNPGRRYSATRHNVGFEVLEILRRHWKLDQGRSGFSGLLTEGRIGPDAERRAMLFAPQTYMNASGRAVRQLVDFYKADPSDVLVVLDDMALPLGRLRLRARGSAGGHNGLGDILEAMGDEAVPRLRIGISPAPANVDPAEFVLSRFRPDETEVITQAINTAAKVVEDWLFNGIDSAMDKFNRKTED